MTVSSNRIYKFLQEIKKKGFCPKNITMMHNQGGFTVYNKKGGYKIFGFSYVDNGKTIYKDTKGKIARNFNEKKVDDIMNKNNKLINKNKGIK